ncbi:MAG: hypothetical protein WCC06_00390 [Candidatus Aminicenantales bacterium]
MKAALNSLFSFQEAPTIPREGLPYWIFWLLLCVILLLLMFIFLRDKDLRRRLSAFLSGAKRRMKRTQLRVRLNREKRKKTDLLKDLGKKIWEEKIPAEKYGPIFTSLESSEKKHSSLQTELKEIISRIIRLKNEQEEVRQELKNLEKLRTSQMQPEESLLREKKEKERLLKKEIRECEKILRKGERTILDLEGLKDVYFEQIGRSADEKRIDHEELFPIYAEIDKVNRSILQLMNQIEDLY